MFVQRQLFVTSFLNTSSLVPMPPLFLLSICVHNNTQERKTSKVDVGGGGGGGGGGVNIQIRTH